VHRELFATYALVFGCALIGLGVTVFVADVQPAFLAWLLGAGAGTMVGAFIAAVATNEPLVGRSALPREPLFVAPRDRDLDEEREAGAG
jgi:hypothetical protein